ncbi:MAG: hypothetical protein NC206_03685 [Bacteroides sp.]|nr:hypothetical protein [Roseburia sp.]MCM1346168.1 hypothetical protein [Bacteroides sp.]MCM1420971.1 hypothetical protein [Bacteroides sp.]
MIEVLWIDDECMTDSGELTNLGTEIVNMAGDEGINITPMLTYKEGINAIKANPKKWCVVILDIHNQNATSGKPSDDFDEAREEITRIQQHNNQKEPYIFVLSGNDQYHGENSIIRQLSYCRRSVYNKCGEDYKLLFEDILKIQNVSKLYTCQEQYKDVLTIAKDFCGEETWEKLLAVLYKITIEDVKNDPALFNDMRKILEDISEGLKRFDYSCFLETKEKVTLNDLSRYVGNDPSVPEYIQRAFHTLDRVVQDGSHSKKTAEDRFCVDDDVSKLKAPYLLRSCVFELCNILIWMRSLE